MGSIRDGRCSGSHHGFLAVGARTPIQALQLPHGRIVAHTRRRRWTVGDTVKPPDRMALSAFVTLVILAGVFVIYVA